MNSARSQAVKAAGFGPAKRTFDPCRAVSVEEDEVAEIMSAEDFLVVCKKWDWDDLEFADELRSRDKAIVERIKGELQKLADGCHIDTDQALNTCDDVLRELGGNL